MIAMASQITSLTIVFSPVFSGADQRKYQSSASLVFLREIHRWPVNSTHKRPVTRKMFAFDNVIMYSGAFGSTTGFWWSISRYLWCIVSDNRCTYAFWLFLCDEFSTYTVSEIASWKSIIPHCQKYISGLILGLHPANERHRYKVTPSLIGWAQT